MAQGDAAHAEPRDVQLVHAVGPESNLLWSCIALHSAVVTLHERQRLASVVLLPVADHDPEHPTSPQPVLLHAA